MGSGHGADSQFAARVTVVVLEAAGLVKKDVFGKNDPYVSVLLGGETGVRSRRRFGNRSAESLSEAGLQQMNGSAKRQYDRTLGETQRSTTVDGGGSDPRWGDLAGGAGEVLYFDVPKGESVKGPPHHSRPRTLIRTVWTIDLRLDSLRNEILPGSGSGF